MTITNFILLILCGLLLGLISYVIECRVELRRIRKALNNFEYQTGMRIKL